MSSREQIELWLSRAWRIARRYLGPEDAEEVTQNVAMKMCDQETGTPDDQAKVLTTITKNESLNRLRKLRTESANRAQYQEHARSRQTAASQELDVIWQETETLARQLIQSMPEMQRRVMLLAEQGVPHYQIANQLQIGLEKERQLYRAGLRALETVLN